MKPHRNNRLSLPLASAIAAMLAPQAAHAQQYWNTNGTNVAINVANWGSTAGGPFTNAFVANTNIFFSATSSITGATVNIGNITVTAGTVTFTPGGILGTGGNVRIIDTALGATLTLSSQAISTAAGTGFTKSGAGTLNSANANAYTGGFTINAGTMSVGHVNAMGAGGALAINGGIIRSNGATARDLTGKYTGGITIGGNFTLGDVTNNGLLTFSNNMALGAASRTITTASNAVFGGIISGDNTVGITKTGVGTLTLSGANTFNGGVTIRNGTLESKTTTTTLGAGTVTMGGAGSTGATYITGQNNSNAFVINAPDSGAVVIGANGAGSGFTMSGGITLNGNLTLQTFDNVISGSIKAQSSFTGGITGTGNVVLNNNGLAANTITMATGVINHTGSLTLQGTATGDTTISANIGANVTGVTQNSATSRLILSGTNSYTGATTVSAGILVVNGNQSSATGAVSVTGTLAGNNGTIGGNTTINAGGRLAMGDGTAKSIGTETFNGTLAFAATSIFEWDLNAPNTDQAGSNQGSYDKVVNNNATAMGGTSVFNVVLADGDNFSDAFWNTSKTWTNVFSGAGLASNLSSIFTSFSGTGIVDTAGVGVVVGEGSFSFNGSTDLTWTAVPEPTSALVGVLVGAGLMRRRRYSTVSGIDSV